MTDHPAADAVIYPQVVDEVVTVEVRCSTACCPGSCLVFFIGHADSPLFSLQPHEFNPAPGAKLIAADYQDAGQPAMVPAARKALSRSAGARPTSLPMRVAAASASAVDGEVNDRRIGAAETP